MSSRVYLFFSPRGHEPPPTLGDRLNPHLSLQRRRFPIPRYVKRPDVALYAIGLSALLIFLLPTPSSRPLLTALHCTAPSIRFSEHDSLWQPPAAHSDERPRPQKSSRAQRCLSALTPGYTKGTVVRGHPMVWSLALCSDCARNLRTKLNRTVQRINPVIPCCHSNRFSTSHNTFCYRKLRYDDR